MHWGNEDLPIQLTHYGFPRLAISNSEILIHLWLWFMVFFTFMVSNCQNVDCSLRNKIIMSFIIIFGTLSFPIFLAGMFRTKQNIENCIISHLAWLVFLQYLAKQETRYYIFLLKCCVLLVKILSAAAQQFEKLPLNSNNIPGIFWKRIFTFNCIILGATTVPFSVFGFLDSVLLLTPA